MSKIKKSDIKKIERLIKKTFKNKTIVAILLIALGVSTFLYNDIYLNNKETAVIFNINNIDVSCVDGDTFKMDGKTIRLLAIDTPETVKPQSPVEPYGKEASDTTCDLLKNASDITLKQDLNNEMDQYGRSLAWVYVDNILLQEHLLELGYAEIKYVNNKTVDKSILKQLKKAEAKAKSNDLGIWSNQ